MRFKQYLNENDAISLDDLLKEAKVKCKPFLDNPTSLPIFRGIFWCKEWILSTANR